jgi:type I restriction enzyme S subunit
VKEGWEITPLGELCDVLDYKRKPITKRDRDAGEYPYYGATGILDYVSSYLFDEPLVLVGEDGAKWGSGENTAFAVDGKIWVNNHAHVLRPHRSILLDRWLIYFLNYSDLAEFVSGLTVPKLNQGSLREIPIPFPPLEEQRRIIGLLDEAFEALAAAKANAERNLQNARALLESHLESVFSQRGQDWVDKSLEELIESSIIGLTKNSREQGEDKAWPYVKMNNITRDNRFDLTSSTRVDATPEEVSKFSLKEGDFLFNTRNSHELVGKSCIYEFASEDPVLFNNNIMRIRFRRGVDPRFVLLAFSSKGVIGQLNALKSGTTNVSAIYFKDLKSLPIPVPPFTEQKRIAAILVGLSEEAQHLTSIYERKLATLDELKASLLHQAFNGEL